MNHDTGRQARLSKETALCAHDSGAFLEKAESLLVKICHHTTSLVRENGAINTDESAANQPYTASPWASRAGDSNAGPLELPDLDMRPGGHPALQQET